MKKEPGPQRPRPSWLLDELAHAGEEHLDPGYVAGYDRKAGTDPTGDVALLQTLGLDATHTLVDLGAGTGTLALAAAPLCRRVVAVDPSPAMLARLRGDFAYSRNALHQLPDFWKALALVRVSAALRPGGVLRLRDLVFSCRPAEVGEVVQAWLAGAARRPQEGWTRAEYGDPPARGAQHVQLVAGADARSGRT